MRALHFSFRTPQPTLSPLWSWHGQLDLVCLASHQCGQTVPCLLCYLMVRGRGSFKSMWTHRTLFADSVTKLCLHVTPYPCPSYADHHDAGEVAHWPTFHTPAVRYARRLADFNQTRDGNSNSTTPYDWSNDTQKLIAFIYGLTVHYVTDEVWEGQWCSPWEIIT